MRLWGWKKKKKLVASRYEYSTIPLSVDNACLWDLFFCISLEIYFQVFEVKSFLHCIFIVACDHSSKLSVKDEQSINVLCACVCVY